MVVVVDGVGTKVVVVVPAPAAAAPIRLKRGMHTMPTAAVQATVLR